MLMGVNGDFIFIRIRTKLLCFTCYSCRGELIGWREMNYFSRYIFIIREKRILILIPYVKALFLTSSTIYGIELSGKGDTQLVFISQSEYFLPVFSVLTLLIKKSASQITGSISFL